MSIRRSSSFTSWHGPQDARWVDTSGSCALHASSRSAELFYLILLLLSDLNVDGHTMKKTHSHVFILFEVITLSTVFLISRDAQTVPKAEHL